MSYTPYNAFKTRWCFRPEYSFAVGESGDAMYAANDAADTFYPMPVLVSNDNIIFTRAKRNWHKRSGAGTRFLRNIVKHEYDEIIITYTGPLVNFTWLLPALQNHTLTDASPVYTHTYDSSGTVTNPPKTIQCYCQILNDKAADAESVFLLFVGGVIQNTRISGQVDGIINGSFEVHFAQAVTAVKLTSFPAPLTSGPFRFGHIGSSGFTWTHGGTAYNCLLRAFYFQYNTNRALKKGTNDYPYVAYSENVVKGPLLHIDVDSWETDIYDDSADVEPDAATNNFDLKITITRATNDYIEFDLRDNFQEYMGGSFIENILQESIDFFINTKDTGSKLVVVEKNALDGTLYT